MKKLILFLPFFLAAAGYPDFRPCYLKYSFVNDSVPVTKNKSVVFGGKKCIDYDPFTDMCIVLHKNRKTVKFESGYKLGWWGAAVKKNEIYVGNFAKEGIFFAPALLSVKTPKNSVVSDMFCRAVGVGRGDGFIPGYMVKHFIRYGYWGDIGIEVDENMKIKSFDPWYVKNLHIGDKILKINYKPATPVTFNKSVLAGIEGKRVVVNVNGRNIKIKIRKKKYLYTPLERFGIYLNDRLKIIKLPEKLEKVYLIKPGAVITGVNGMKIKSFEELKKALSTYKNVTISVSYKNIKATIPLR
ncbi:DUF7488 domain-containing protein [Nautilia sp.]